jgi:carbonic anhydrase/acetyltransferase-like protein (isoleucine patch superfamily)
VPWVLPYGDRSPVVDPTTWLAPNATVVGQVRLHARSSVFYGAVVRGDMAEIVVGRGTNLQDLVVVHTDTDFPGWASASGTRPWCTAAPSRTTA